MMIHAGFLIVILICAAINYANIFSIYSDTGLLKLTAEPSHLIVALMWMVLVVLFIPRSIRKPSDFFLLLYNLACFLWGSIFWPITGLVRLEQVPMFMLLLALPSLAVLLLRTKITKCVSSYLPPIQLASWRHNTIPLALIGFAGALLAYLTLGDGSFGFQGVYERRLEARLVLPDHPLANYALNMATNGAVPLLAFIASYRRSWWPGLAAIGYVVLIYWLVGQKSPILNVAVMMGAGAAARAPRIWNNLVPIFHIGVIVVYGSSLLLTAINGSVAIADIVVRRISVIQPQIQSYYFDLWVKSNPMDMLFGLDKGRYADYTYMIGDLYLKNGSDNANVNAFMYSLVSKGVVGYCISIIIIIFVLSLLDSFFQKTRRFEFYGLAIMFSILLSEQAYTTSLLSSGIAVCLVLVMLFSYP